jgi:sirohydrochlorin cobaltochelatase
VFVDLGFRRVAVAWWYLCYGRLIERGRRELAAVAGSAGVDLVDCGYIGPDPRLVPLILERYEEARHGRPAVNCDACAYRAPWPGREDRVGQPVGVGHSHLAAEHRHHH